MSGVFRNIDQLPPHRPASVQPAFGAVGGHTRRVERGWGVNSSEDARHCSVLYKCKYFVATPLSVLQHWFMLAGAVCPTPFCPCRSPAPEGI
jgi:hypothetical protein